MAVQKSTPDDEFYFLKWPVNEVLSAATVGPPAADLLEHQVIAEHVSSDGQTIPFQGSYVAAPPVVLTSPMSFFGQDTGTFQILEVTATGFDVLFEEEQSITEEVNHNAETIGYAAFGVGVLRNNDGAVVGETGQTAMAVPAGGDVSNHWVTVDFRQAYTDPVVIATKNTRANTDPGHVRIRNVNADSFEYRYEEWLYQDNAVNQEETIVYLVAERGTHALENSNGVVLHADTVTTTDTYSTYADIVDAGYGTVPAIFAQSQTVNGAQPIVTRLQNPTAGGAWLKMQEEESQTDGIHATETIGVVAIGSV